VKGYDAIVLGLGAMGSAALHQLAKRGARVLGLEQFGPAHALGSSHGHARVIRQAYAEDPAYVPLLRRAYELWEELQAETDETIWRRTGGVSVGLPDADAICGALLSARRHDVPCELLEASELRRRFPMFAPRPDEVGVYEAGMATLFPERCVLAQLQAAARAGAEARFGCRVSGVTFGANAPASVRLGDGSQAETERLIVCAGAWIDTLFPGRWPVRVERNVQHWFAGRTGAAPGAFPIFLLARDDLPHLFYGFPDFGHGHKVAFHHSGAFVARPEALERTVAPAEVAAARAALESWAPEAAGPHLGSSVCMYTLTPDTHFIVGLLPDVPAAVAAGFSGHGFKFAPLLGEALADLALTGTTAHPLELFDPARFGYS
jgi:sarcosine oxidase